MVIKYVQTKNKLKDIFKDLVQSIEFQPVFRSMMKKIDFFDGLIVTLLIYMTSLFLKILVLYIFAKDLKILSDLIFWIAQLSYIPVLVVLFFIDAFAFNFFFKKQTDSIVKWYYLSSLIFFDSFVYIVFSHNEIVNKVYEYLKFLVVIAVSIFTVVRIQVNYRPGDRIEFKEKFLVFAFALVLSFLNYAVLYWFGYLFIKYVLYK